MFKFKKQKMVKRILFLVLIVNSINIYSQNNEIILLESILYRSTKDAEKKLKNESYMFYRSENMGDYKEFFFRGKYLLTMTDYIGYEVERGEDYVDRSFILVNSSKKCQNLLDQIKKRGAKFIRTQRQNNRILKIYQKTYGKRYEFYTIKKNKDFCQVTVYEPDEEEE